MKMFSQTCFKAKNSHLPANIPVFSLAFRTLLIIYTGYLPKNSISENTCVDVAESFVNWQNNNKNCCIKQNC